MVNRDLPALHGGRACLDFVNTVDPREQGGYDFLDGFEGFLAWAAYASAVSDEELKQAKAEAKRAPRRAAAAFKQLIETRELLYEILNAFATGSTPSRVTQRRFATLVADTQSERTLALHRGRWLWSREDADPLERPRIALVEDAIELLSGSSEVRRCAGERCGWLFIDATKNHSRRWCNMAGCGNRAKSKRFQERHRPALR